MRCILVRFRIVTNLCTYLQFCFSVLQLAHCIRDIVSTNDCVTLEHTPRPPSHLENETGPESYVIC